MNFQHQHQKRLCDPSFKARGYQKLSNDDDNADTTQQQVPNRTLKVEVRNCRYPIDEAVLRTVFTEAHFVLESVHCGPHSYDATVAYVELPNPAVAGHAMQQMQNKEIYPTCCIMKVTAVEPASPSTTDPTASTANANGNAAVPCQEENVPEEVTLPFLSRLRSIFLSPKGGTFAEHVALYNEDTSMYLAEVLMLLRSVDVSRNAKVYALLLGFQFHDHDHIKLLLSDRVNYALPDVLATARALDATRAHRSTLDKIASISNRPEVKAVLDRARRKQRVFKNDSARADEEDDMIAAMLAACDGDGDVCEASREAKRKRTVEESAACRPKPPPPASLAEPKSKKAWKRPPGKPKKPEGAEDLPRKLVRNLASITRLKSQAAIRANEKIEGLTATLSGHSQRFFCQWAESLEAEDLGHFLLEFGLQSWAELADLVHIDPRKMKLSSFLPFAFATRSKYTAESKLACPVHLPPNLAFSRELEKAMRKLPNYKRAKLMRDSLDQVVEHRVPYGFLKRLVPLSFWDPLMKTRVAEYLSLTTLLWWIEELACPTVEDLISARLAAGEKPTFGYGKLMERLMYCSGKRSQLLAPLVPLAQRTMEQYTMPLRTPMAVLGDCSASMQVAVRTASIIGSLLAALGSAELHFFNHHNIVPPFVPNTIKEVLVIADEIQANCATAPAASLELFYYRRVKMETIIIVTDEEENTCGPRSGLFFGELAEKYVNEISPDCRFVFVSFLASSAEGQMVEELKTLGLPFVQCRLNGNRPDLTKLDMLLGKLSMDTSLREVATRALALILSTTATTKPTSASSSNCNAVAVAAQEEGDEAVSSLPRELQRLDLNFRTESTKTTIELLRRAAAAVSDAEQFTALKAICNTFIECLGSGAFPARCAENLQGTSCVEDLRQWIESEWTSAFEQTAHAHLSRQTTNDTVIATDEITAEQRPVKRRVQHRDASCGSLSFLPSDALVNVLSFLQTPEQQVVSRAFKTGGGMERELKVAAFDAQFKTRRMWGAVRGGRGGRGGNGGRGGRGGYGGRGRGRGGRGAH